MGIEAAWEGRGVRGGAHRAAARVRPWADPLVSPLSGSLAGRPSPLAESLRSARGSLPGAGARIRERRAVRRHLRNQYHNRTTAATQLSHRGTLCHTGVLCVTTLQLHYAAGPLQLQTRVLTRYAAVYTIADVASSLAFRRHLPRNNSGFPHGC